MDFLQLKTPSLPEKPDSMRDKVDVLWDVVCNDLLHKTWAVSFKTDLMITLSAIALALMGITVALVAGLVAGLVPGG